jgi:glycosyltransferase involved in cell wall biosynthesis
MLVDLAHRSEESRIDHSVALITPNDQLARMLRDADLTVHQPVGRVREGPLPFLWQALGPHHANWIASVLERERADIAHLHTFASQVVGTRAAMQVGARVLRTEHSTRAFEDPSCWPFSRWSLARSDVSVAISDHVRGAVVARAPWAAGKVRVVANGVDTERFAPRDVGGASSFGFVWVGRLEKRKGADLAIAALARVAEARLDVVGDGAERAELQRFARRRGVADRVRFHGYVDDPRDIVAGANAALCSSRSEGLGIALLEAMAMARPVVGFAVGGVREIVKDEQTGLLAQAGNVEALAARMMEATAAPDHMRALGQTARKYVVERFSVQAMRTGYADVYVGLASEVPSPCEARVP